MTTDPETLDRIRRDIDRIDDRIHDLLMERAAMVERVAEAKAADTSVALRPGREAQIMRRLAARHCGRFPLPAVVRIWREIMGALVGLQRPFSIAICQPERGDGYLELARDHFGVVWPKQVFPSPGHVVRAVADGHASVGVVPPPHENDHEPWWLSLTAGSGDLPQEVTPQPMLTQPPEVGPPQPLEGHRAEGCWLHLCEVECFLAADDLRLTTLLGDGKDPVRHARVIGGYPLQLNP